MKHLALLIAVSTMLLPAFLMGCSEDTPFEATTSYSHSEDPGAAPQAVTREFLGHWDTTFGPGDPNFECDDDDETLPALIEGIGTALHMGLTSFVGDSEFKVPGSQCGRGVFIAADGDVVRVVVEDGVISAPDEAGNISFSGDWVITGGTGRFEGATGGGTSAGTGIVFGPGAGTGEVTYIGTITY